MLIHGISEWQLDLPDVDRIGRVSRSPLDNSTHAVMLISQEALTYLVVPLECCIVQSPWLRH